MSSPIFSISDASEMNNSDASEIKQTNTMVCFSMIRKGDHNQDQGLEKKQETMQYDEIRHTIV